MPPGDQLYYSTVQNATFYPNRAVHQEGRCIGLAHLNTLHTAVMLDIPVSVFLTAKHTFLGRYRTGGREMNFDPGWEVTASGLNKELRQYTSLCITGIISRNKIIVDIFTIERRIDIRFASAENM
ncbi:hypothetical protein EDC94DRAFT_656256 [Helicostylum pulchrum]|nr:hypothetical protein EDC94DRAFT_656256 [Helicostylum pulchrum]